MGTTEFDTMCEIDLNSYPGLRSFGYTVAENYFLVPPVQLVIRVDRLVVLSAVLGSVQVLYKQVFPNSGPPPPPK